LYFLSIIPSAVAAGLLLNLQMSYGSIFHLTTLGWCVVAFSILSAVFSVRLRTQISGSS
jgi:hypothetical protein